MNSVIIAAGSAILYLVAYHTYGKFIARKVFKINPKNICPSVKYDDDVDYVPTKKSILFGHHFTSIAGTGPIVGPAIAIIWGWVPALVWSLFGAIFMGAVHDFGALVVSLRHQGRSIGDIAGDLINNRVRALFLIIIFFALLIVVAIFGVVIAKCFGMYPQAVLPVWLQIPIALGLGYLVCKKKFPVLFPSIIAIILMYITIFAGAHFPMEMPTMLFANKAGKTLLSLDPTAIWVVLLLVYVYIASTLPVHVLLQPRDYINSHQLLIAMGLLALGVLFTHPTMAAPALNLHPKGAPPILPMIFVVLACGAVSGFHSLVSSGTSSKQCDCESNARFIGYGSMLLEGMLAVFVIIACGAGIGLGLTDDGETFTGAAAFSHQYSSWAAAKGLSSKINAFVAGATQMLAGIGVPKEVAITILGVFIVSFAATTLDTATRIQRYIVGELAKLCKVPFLAGKHPATLIAVTTAFLLAFHNGSGKGALRLWPLFGCTNQLLAGLALLVVTVYLAKKKYPIVFTLLPMVFMIFMTGWAMTDTIKGFYLSKDWLLLGIGIIIMVLEIWMIIESIIVLKNIFSNREDDKTAEPFLEPEIGI